MEREERQEGKAGRRFSQRQDPRCKRGCSICTLVSLWCQMPCGGTHRPGPRLWASFCSLVWEGSLFSGAGGLKTASPVIINLWLPTCPWEPSTDSHGLEEVWEKDESQGSREWGGLLFFDLCVPVMSLPATGPGEARLHTAGPLGSEWNPLLRFLLGDSP